MRAKEEAYRVLAEALDVASQGVDEAEVALLGGTVGMTRFADNEVHQPIELNQESMSVRVVKEGRCGRVETTDLSRDGLESAVRQARMAAQFLPEPAEPTELPVRNLIGQRRVVIR